MREDYNEGVNVSGDKGNVDMEDVYMVDMNYSIDNEN